MRQKILIIASVVVKNIVFHIVISSFRFIIFFFRNLFACELSHHCENGGLLFFGHGFKDVLNSFNLLIFFLFITKFIIGAALFILLFIRFICRMLQLSHDHFIIAKDNTRFSVPVHYHIIDKCSRIGTG